MSDRSTLRVNARRRRVPGVLNFDFTKKALVQGGIAVTFTRSTVATYFDSTGVLKTAPAGEPRFDYDPADNSALGLLIEEQRTNSLLDNRDLSTGNWDVTATIAQDQTSLDGVSNKAWTVTDDSASLFERFIQTITVSDDTATHVWSAFIKKDNDESRFPRFDFILNNGTTELSQETRINTKTGNTSEDNSDGTVTVQDYGEWWRVISTLTNNNTGNTSLRARCYCAVSTTLGGATDASTTGSIVYDFGQVELNASFATSPIETAGSAVTRNADRRTTSVTDGAYKTVVIAARTGFDAGVLWQLDDGTENNRIRIERDGSNNILCIVTDGGAEQANMNVGSVADNTGFKVAMAWAANDIAACLDGGTVGTDGTATIPTGLTTWRGGHDTAGEEFNGWTASETAYADRRADSFLQSETT